MGPASASADGLRETGACHSMAAMDGLGVLRWLQTRAARRLPRIRWSQALTLSKPGKRQTADGAVAGGGTQGGVEQGWVGCWEPRRPDRFVCSRGRERKGGRGVGAGAATGS